MNKIQAVYTAVNIRLQLQPTKLIGRSKFIIKFMASLHPQFTEIINNKRNQYFELYTRMFVSIIARGQGKGLSPRTTTLGYSEEWLTC